MALITWPAAILPRSFSLQLQVNQRSHASSYGGGEQSVDLLNDRWLASMSLPSETLADAAAVEAFINNFRGLVNWVAVYHRARSAPRGTLRGSPVLDAAVSQGADELVIDASAGETLLAGDLLGCDGLLLQVAEDCTANGSGIITVPLVNRVRRAIADATAVVWDAPTVPMRLVNRPMLTYMRARAEGVDLELAEYIA